MPVAVEIGAAQQEPVGLLQVYITEGIPPCGGELFPVPLCEELLNMQCTYVQSYM